MNHEEGKNPRQEEAVDRVKWLLGIWSGSSSGVGAGGDVFAAQRGFDMLVLSSLSLSISPFLEARRCQAGCSDQLAGTGQTLQKRLDRRPCAQAGMTEDRGVVGADAKITEAGYKPDVSLHGGRWGASSPGTIEDLRGPQLLVEGPQSGAESLGSLHQ